MLRHRWKFFQWRSCQWSQTIPVSAVNCPAQCHSCKIIVWRNNMAVVNFSCVELPFFKSSWRVTQSVSNIKVTQHQRRHWRRLSDFRYDNVGEMCADVLLSIQKNWSDFFRMTQRVEKENFWGMKFKIFPARGNGPGYRVARCFVNLSPLIYCLDPRLTYINKQIFTPKIRSYGV